MGHGHQIMALWLKNACKLCDTSLTPPEDPVIKHAKDSKDSVHFSSGIVETCLNTEPNTSSINIIAALPKEVTVLPFFFTTLRHGTYHLDVILAEIQFLQP
jgi:hypothetical protein